LEGRRQGFNFKKKKEKRILYPKFGDGNDVDHMRLSANTIKLAPHLTFIGPGIHLSVPGTPAHPFPILLQLRLGHFS
jgi:hypothetical protein